MASLLQQRVFLRKVVFDGGIMDELLGSNRLASYFQFRIMIHGNGRILQLSFADIYKYKLLKLIPHENCSCFCKLRTVDERVTN